MVMSVVSLVWMQGSKTSLEAQEDQDKRKDANQENQPVMLTAHGVLRIISSVVVGNALTSDATLHYRGPNIIVLW